MTRPPRYALALLLIVVLAPAAASAQGAVADYERAMTLRDAYQNLAVNVPEQPTWIARTNRFWYRRTVRGRQRVRAGQCRDAGEGSAVRSREARRRHLVRDGREVHRRDAPVHHVHVRRQRPRDRIPLSAGGPGGGAGRGAPPGGPGGPPMWRCSLETYTCRPPAAAGRGGRGGRGGGGLAGPVRPPFDINGAEPKKSPDDKLEARRQQLQRRDPRGRQARGHAAQHGRIRRRLLRSRLAGLVARLDEDCRLQGDARLPPLRPLRRVLARGPAPAEALDDAVREAGRRASTSSGP